ncbi:hypothetical protein MNBD_IGNAVI01-484 [hydrothermal vent metagenome]|uniref:Isochorismatase-like domain-containing protein n=1 Tax=hydrothermal vent metagenome TaxID=652676 RepID=A0A3B1CKX1_9ZZZZ
MKSALLVIDMINDYLHPDGLLYCERCREIIPALVKAITFARENTIQVVYVNTNLENKNDLLAKRWGLHAVKGSFGAQVIDELRPDAGDLIIPKKSYNAFFNTSLDTELEQQGIKNITISGIHTHVCVLLTAVGGFELGYNVTVLEDCITTDNEAMRKTRLTFFNTHVGEMISSDEWKRRIKADLLK